VLPADTDMVKTVLHELYDKELWKIPLAQNTVGRKMFDASEDLCDPFIDQLKSRALHFR
jgi:hypothetical protein